VIRPLLTRLTSVACAVLLTLALIAAPASATEPALTHAAAVAVGFTLDPATVVQLLVAFVLPLLVGLVTTRVTSAAVKAWLLAALTLVASLLVELGRTVASGGVFDVGVALLAALPAFVVSVATHYGLWKPTGVSGAAQDVGSGRHVAP
jgi:hypothetical protein